MSGPYLEDKLATPKDTGGTKARCTTKQLKERFGVWIAPDGQTAKVTSMKVTNWKQISKDVWEVCE